MRTQTAAHAKIQKIKEERLEDFTEARESWGYSIKDSGRYAGVSWRTATRYESIRKERASRNNS